MSKIEPIHVIGGGLAGSEATWQIAQAGVPVILHEMRPVRGTDAHKTQGLAELVCSNSFRSDDAETNAVGLIDRINGVDPAESQFRFDITFGPPPVYRESVLRLAFDILGSHQLQFGSDRFLPCPGAHIRAAIDEVVELLDRLEIAPDDRRELMSGTAARWLRLPEAAGV